MDARSNLDELLKVLLNFQGANSVIVEIENGGADVVSLAMPSEFNVAICDGLREQLANLVTAENVKVRS